MSLPNLPQKDNYRREVRTEWGGINLNENAGDGELIEAVNMSSREYPLLANSRLRSGNPYSGEFTSPFIFRGNLGALYIDDDAVKLSCPIGDGPTLDMRTSQASDAQCVSMNKQLYIFPAKQSTELYSSSVYDMEATWTGRAAFTNGTYEGVAAEANTISAPGLTGNWPFKAGDAVKISGSSNANNKTAIIREVDNTNKQLRFYENTFVLRDGWSYFCESALSAGTYYFSYPNEWGALNFTLTAAAAAGSWMYLSANGSAVIVTPPTGSDYSCAVSSGSGGTKLDFENPGPVLVSNMKLERTVPDMDFVFVNENRMWGCKGDTIYASKLGDPLNWNVFDGLSTDSWTASTGTDGDFTAGLSFQGYPTFFKENAVFRVFGDSPSNFALRKSLINGVARYSSKSVVEIGDTLIYYAPCGFVQWNGGVPRIISGPLGLAPGKRYAATALKIHAGTDTVRYYVSTHIQEYSPEYDTDLPQRHDYVYDTRYGTWHELEFENSWELYFAHDSASCYMLNQQMNYDPETYEYDPKVYVYNLLYLSGVPDTTTDWRVTFADSTRYYKTSLTGSESKKGVLRLLIRCRLAGSMKVWIAYDGGEFEQAAEFGGDDGLPKTSRVVPLILRRCDFWQLRLTGTGDAVIYSIAVEKYGSEWQQA